MMAVPVTEGTVLVINASDVAVDAAGEMLPPPVTSWAVGPGFLPLPSECLPRPHHEAFPEATAVAEADPEFEAQVERNLWEQEVNKKANLQADIAFERETLRVLKLENKEARRQAQIMDEKHYREYTAMEVELDEMAAQARQMAIAAEEGSSCNTENE